MVGRTLGLYRVDRKLGQGGMGAVYLAHDTNLQRPVAIKVLSHQLADDAEYVDRFVREARLAAQVNHANVVQVYYAAAEEGVAFMALELIEGGSLKELVEQGKVPARQAVQIVRDAARGLGAAHKRGIIHRDLKPENILLTRDGEVKIADFGLARSGVSTITQTGIYMGTPHYSSPEQCATDDVSAASDLYSLGVVLYELLAGTLPHDAKTPVALFSQIMSTPPPPLSEHCPDLPPSLQTVVKRLLQKQPEDRYADADALVADLERVLPSLQDVAPVLPTSSGLGSAIAATVRVKTPTGGDAEALLASLGGRSSSEDEGYTPPTGSMVGRLGVLAAVLLLLSGGLYMWLSGLSQGATRPARVAIAGTWANKTSDPNFAWLEGAIPEFLASELGADIDIRFDELGDFKDSNRARSVLEGSGWEGAVGGRFYAEGLRVGVTICAFYPGGSLRKSYRLDREHVLDQLAEAAKQFAVEFRAKARVVDRAVLAPSAGVEMASVEDSEVGSARQRAPADGSPASGAAAPEKELAPPAAEVQEPEKQNADGAKPQGRAPSETNELVDQDGEADSDTMPTRSARRLAGAAGAALQDAANGSQTKGDGEGETVSKPAAAEEPRKKLEDFGVRRPASPSPNDSDVTGPGSSETKDSLTSDELATLALETSQWGERFSEVAGNQFDLVNLVKAVVESGDVAGCRVALKHVESQRYFPSQQVEKLRAVLANGH